MARSHLTAAALVLLCAVAVQASSRFVVEGAAGRDLLQAEKTPNCTRIHKACDTCRNQRIPGTRRSELVCSTCKSGYRLRRDGQSKTCDCAPGLALDGSGNCAPCELGKFCLGGDAKVNPTNAANDCPTGLTTTFAGAKSQAQCFTQPGYGRVSTKGSDGKVTLSAVECVAGTYNVGANTAGCQKCGSGLTTASTASNSSSLCLAPAGSYLDKGIGKLCQKGTYSEALNANPTCTVCPTGITTASEGSDQASDCALAMKGYYLVNATTAALCPVDHYNDEEAAVSSCKVCPNGWRTKDTGATGLALCLAPPGFELKENADNITECENGLYKADWNRNPCVECGTGLITASTGSVSKDACLVPAGWGLTQITPSMIAEPCESNYYGDAVDRPAVANARCTPCPADMFTLDTLGTPRGATLYTSEDACKVQAGWGTTATTPQKCPKGTYNAGLNREPCKECITGMTTVADMKTSVDQCVIQPGWKMGADGIPAPCDKGTFSEGGSEAAPNATCTSCDTGFSTQEDESVAETECEVCAPGYGNVAGTNCAQCDYGYYAAGGAAKTDACVPCADGTTSRRRASQSQMCFSKLVDVRNDVFNLGTDAWTTAASSYDTAASCGDACYTDTACIMYRFALDGTKTCQLFLKDAAGNQTIGFKIGSGDDYVTYPVPASQTVGASIGTSSAADEKACSDACSDSSECEVYSWSGSTCTLLKSELEQDYVSMFAVRGNHLYSDRAMA